MGRLVTSFCSLAALLLSLAGVPMASAHTTLVHAIPAPGAVVPVAPARVTLIFAEPLKPEKGTSLTVYDSHGKQVSTGTTQIAPGNLAAMSVTMQGDGPGVYVVIWQTVSATDGAVDHGAYAFTVDTARTATAAAPANTPVFFGPVSTMPPWFTGVVGLVMFLGGVALGAAGRRRARRRTEQAQQMVRTTS
jgi:methionine-rich copper-binding protein CopC